MIIAFVPFQYIDEYPIFYFDWYLGNVLVTSFSF